MSMGMPSWPGPVLVSPLFVPGASINVECGKRAERTLIDGMVQEGSGEYSRRMTRSPGRRYMQLIMVISRCTQTGSSGHFNCSSTLHVALVKRIAAK